MKISSSDVEALIEKVSTIARVNKILKLRNSSASEDGIPREKIISLQAESVEQKIHLSVRSANSKDEFGSPWIDVLIEVRKLFKISLLYPAKNAFHYLTESLT